MFFLSGHLFIVVFINQFDLPSGKMSGVWKHYTLNEGKTVTCKICGNKSILRFHNWNVVSPRQKTWNQKGNTGKVDSKSCNRIKIPKISIFLLKATN